MPLSNNEKQRRHRYYTNLAIEWYEKATGFKINEVREIIRYSRESIHADRSSELDGSCEICGSQTDLVERDGMVICTLCVLTEAECAAKRNRIFDSETVITDLDGMDHE